MICRSCGTDIAAKAIVCYRCGAPTAEPARRAASAPAPRGARSIVALVVVIALVILAALILIGSR